MVDWKDLMTVSRQCELMDLPHTIFYHLTKPVQDEDLVELDSATGLCLLNFLVLWQSTHSLLVG